MSLTNPNRVVKASQLNYFKSKADALYQTKAISAIAGLNAENVEAAIAELLGKIQAIPSAIIPKGTRTFSQLAPATDLVAGNLGFMWNISDAFTTDSNFVEGSGKSVAAGSNVYVVNNGTTAEPSYKYDIFAGPIDLSGYALKSEMSVTDGEGANADKTTITLKTGTSATVLKSHQDISGKANKVTVGTGAGEATAGNFFGIGSDGDLVDSGSKASDFATAAQGAKADSAVQSVAEGATNGTVAVDGTDVAVHGLGSAAYKADTYFEPAITYATDSDIDEMFA